MKRIPCAFHKDPQTGLATLQPAVDWFVSGQGVATRKWDGVPYLIGESTDDDGALIFYKGFRSPLVTGAYSKRTIITSRSDDEVTGWMPVPPTDAWFMELIQAHVYYGNALQPGAYELCGPSIKDNPERLPNDMLIRHDLISYLWTPRTLDDLLVFMARIDPGEGIVWRYGDEYCQLTRTDVGLPWPMPES